MGAPGVGDRLWHVLLVGGASGVGKSELTAALAQRYTVGTAEIDDLLAAVLAVTSRTTHPLLHEPAQAAGDRAVQAQIDIARALQPAVRAVVSTHLDHGPAVILEGDHLLPGIIDDAQFGPSVRVVFIHEPDRDQIAANLATREPGTPNQDARAHVSWLYGEHLRNEAAARGIPILAARPWATQLERIADLLTTA
jgi:2-phosphoglycerate kinase